MTASEPPASYATGVLLIALSLFCAVVFGREAWRSGDPMMGLLAVLSLVLLVPGLNALRG